ncbi:MAG: site-specific integrase [Gammaproteobacteria bacterium]|nr:site-specific integrase [Gammaproteobacteria bacterium]
MATITNRGDGQWQATVRKKGYSTQSKTFKTKTRAEQWARNVESEMGRSASRRVGQSLQWANINMLKRTAILSGTKNGDDREIPLSSKVVAVIERQPHQITGFLFSIRGDPVTQAFSRVCKNARIKDLRFDAASRFFEMGLEPMEVSAITGHKDLAMLKRYTHLKTEDLVKKPG